MIKRKIYIVFIKLDIKDVFRISLLYFKFNNYQIFNNPKFTIKKLVYLLTFLLYFLYSNFLLKPLIELLKTIFTFLLNSILTIL